VEPIRLPAREIPVPTSVSEPAQSMVGLGPLRQPHQFPAPDDLAGWRALVTAEDEAMLSLIGDRVSQRDVDVRELDTAGVRVFEITPRHVAASDPRVYLDIHGGGFVQGGGELCRLMGVGSAGRWGRRVWAVDYRMPPDHPYPAPLDDCVTAYQALIAGRSAASVIVGGVSAGGNLAAALILRARDEGLPLPAAAVLMTPEADLTESGDSFRTNLGLDPLLPQSLLPGSLLYANGADLADPYLSPLFADFSAGFPPTVLSTGTRDLFLSNTVLLHRALRTAGVAAELHVLEAAGHGGFLGMAPEDRELDREIRAFIDRQWGA